MKPSAALGGSPTSNMTLFRMCMVLAFMILIHLHIIIKAWKTEFTVYHHDPHEFSDFRYSTVSADYIKYLSIINDHNIQ